MTYIMKRFFGWLKRSAINLINLLIASSFLLYWLIFEAGRMGAAGSFIGIQHTQLAWIFGTIPFVLIAASIAVSHWRPTVALALGVLALLSFSLIARWDEQTTWPALFGLLYAFANIALFAPQRLYRHLWWVSLLAVAVLLGIPTAGFVPVPLLWATCIPYSLVIVTGLIASLLRYRQEDIVSLAQAEWQRYRRDTSALLAREAIARDVHDIMAHSLAVIAVQADVARLQLEADHAEVARPVQSLRDIAEVSRDALRELRLVLDAVVGDERIQAETKNIDELITRTESTGHAVIRTELGEPVELDGPHQRTLYRLVQEALTNAVKYAPADSEIELTIDWRDEALMLSVRSGLGGPLPQPAVPGRGILGMTRRAELLGGWLTAGPDDDAHLFIVTAELPLRATPAPAPAEVAA